MVGATNKKNYLFLLLTLIVIIIQIHFTVSSPIDNTDLALKSEDILAVNNLVIQRDENLVQVQKKKTKRKRKKKRKRKRKKKTLRENKGQDPLGSIVTDLASIFESFLSSVTDVPKDDEAIKLIRIIADSVNKIKR